MDFKRLLTLPLSGKSSIFLFGPRGTGKTSWIKEHIPDALYFDLLDFQTYSALSANPSYLEQLITFGFTGWIVIDEVQRIPELLNEVHRLIEHRKMRFILTGSSARSLRRAGVNLLAGRALNYYMHPLVIQELPIHFDLAHVLRFGLLPAVVTHPDPESYLDSYVKTYLEQEVLQEGLTRNIGAFTRFLQVASFSQASVLNFAEIGRELGMNRMSVSSYFDILQDLLIAVRIPVFTLRAKRKTITHEKFYFFDCGVFNTVRPRGPLDTIEEIEGAALETLFLQSLRAVNDYYRLGYKIYFWRTVDGQEVDFVLYGPRGFHAFELKRSAVITSKSMKGLVSFGKDYPEAKLYILFGGKQPEYHDTVTALPFVQALRDLPQILGA